MRKVFSRMVMVRAVSHWCAFIFIIGLLMGVSAIAHADGWGKSQADNALMLETSEDSLRGGIANTRHNLTMSYSGFRARMNDYRNDYFEICVYCHTPHGANQTAAAPLWNRTVSQRSYTLYNQVTALGRPMTQPGPNSLTCLSCHDGATAIDSIINMPTQLVGAFRAGYNARQESTVNFEFLNQWQGNKLQAEGKSASAGGHSALNALGDPEQDNNGPCITCHTPSQQGGGAAGLGPDFELFVIGGDYTSRLPPTVDANGRETPAIDDAGRQALAFGASSRADYLADDHPVGVRYPTEFGPGVDYNEPSVQIARISFFDLNGNNHADPNEVRLYDTGDGYEVECASCHDPHGVPLNGSSVVADATGAGTPLIPSFLRVGQRVSKVTGTRVSANAGSELCLTCHIK